MSKNWISRLSMPEPPGNPSALDNNDLEPDLAAARKADADAAVERARTGDTGNVL